MNRNINGKNLSCMCVYDMRGADIGIEGDRQYPESHITCNNNNNERKYNSVAAPSMVTVCSFSHNGKQICTKLDDSCGSHDERSICLGKFLRE